jgi:hypothetical protein
MGDWLQYGYGEYPVATSGIRFNDCLFSEPVTFAGWTPPKYPGIYCVLVNDPNWAPKAFQPLYFGEFGNNAPESVILQDCRQAAACAQGKNVFVAVLAMPFSTLQQRFALRHELILAYNPACQTDPGMKPADLWPLSLQTQDDAPRAARRRIGFIA